MTTIDAQFEHVVRRIDPASTLLRAWPLAGGVSAQVTALEVERPGGERGRMIVRQHGERDRRDNPRIAADEFKLLGRLKAEGLPTPTPYYVDESGEIFPLPYIVVEYIDGVTEFAPADLTDFLAQLTATLTRIHAVDGALPELAFLPKLRDIAHHKLNNRPERLDDSIREADIRDALESAWPLPQLNRAVLLHGDYWLGNLLWRDGRLVGVIDWEDGLLGDVLGDLGKTRLEILWTLGRAAMEQFTEQYRAMMPAINFTHQPFWDLYAALKTAFRLGEWAESETQERTMRERLAWFVAEALTKISL